MFKTLVITLGIAYAVKQLIVPVITTNRNNRRHQVEFDILKAQVIEDIKFLPTDRYQRTFEGEDRNYLRIEYLDLRQQRKIRIELNDTFRAFDIKVIDKEFYPVSIQTISNDINLAIDLNPITGNRFKDLSKNISILSNALRNQLHLIEDYKSFRNEAYYTKMLFKIKDKTVLSKNITLFNWNDSVFRSHLTKHYCELSLRENNIKYAEIALILNAIMPIVENRDLFPQLTLIYFTINKINHHPKQVFNIYAKKVYNKHKNVFENFLNLPKGTITAKSMGYKLKLNPEIKFDSKYQRRLDSFEKWHMHNK